MSFDRDAMRRTDSDYQARALADPESMVLVVAPDGRVPVRDNSLAFVAAPKTEAPADAYLFLGQLGGRAVYALAVDELPADAASGGFRELGAMLPDGQAEVLCEAVALTAWHVSHRFCPGCGAATTVEAAGHVRRCTVEGIQHFPRTDPAVIMLVHDGAGWCVLGRTSAWPAGRFSTLAGFVEAGESLEEAVRREVHEEVGLQVRRCQYVASQSWPYPRSLMLGFYAHADRIDLELADGEIAEARWWEREALREAVHEGAIVLPGPSTIARRLIDGWLWADLDRQL